MRQSCIETYQDNLRHYMGGRDSGHVDDDSFHRYMSVEGRIILNKKHERGKNPRSI